MQPFDNNLFHGNLSSGSDQQRRPPYSNWNEHTVTYQPAAPTSTHTSNPEIYYAPQHFAPIHHPLTHPPHSHYPQIPQRQPLPSGMHYSEIHSIPQPSAQTQHPQMPQRHNYPEIPSVHHHSVPIQPPTMIHPSSHSSYYSTQMPQRQPLPQRLLNPPSQSTSVYYLPAQGDRMQIPPVRPPLPPAAAQQEPVSQIANRIATVQRQTQPISREVQQNRSKTMVSQNMHNLLGIKGDKLLSSYLVLNTTERRLYPTQNLNFGNAAPFDRLPDVMFEFYQQYPASISSLADILTHKELHIYLRPLLLFSNTPMLIQSALNNFQSKELQYHTQIRRSIHDHFCDFFEEIAKQMEPVPHPLVNTFLDTISFFPEFNDSVAHIRTDGNNLSFFCERMNFSCEWNALLKEVASFILRFNPKAITVSEGFTADDLITHIPLTEGPVISVAYLMLMSPHGSDILNNYLKQATSNLDAAATKSLLDDISRSLKLAHDEMKIGLVRPTRLLHSYYSALEQIRQLYKIDRTSRKPTTRLTFNQTTASVEIFPAQKIALQLFDNAIAQVRKKSSDPIDFRRLYDLINPSQPLPVAKKDCHLHFVYALLYRDKKNLVFEKYFRHIYASSPDGPARIKKLYQELCDSHESVTAVYGEPQEIAELFKDIKRKLLELIPVEAPLAVPPKVLSPNEALYKAQIAFYTTLRTYLNDARTGDSFRALLFQEKGLFALHESAECSVLQLLEKVYNDSFIDSSAMEEFKEPILRDFISFFNVYSTKTLHNPQYFSGFSALHSNNELRASFWQGKRYLDDETARRILESFLMVKLAEYKNNIKAAREGVALEEVEERSIPCFFIYRDAANAPVLKAVNAFFDRKGALQGVFQDNGCAKEYLASLNLSLSNSDATSISSECLENLKQILHSSPEVPFILLEEKWFNPVKTTEEKKTKRKREVSEKIAEKKASKKTRVVQEDIQQLYTHEVKKKEKAHKHTLNESMPREKEEAPATSFWQGISLAHCKSFQSKATIAKTRKVSRKRLAWNVPDFAAIRSKKRTLHMLQAKPYQSEGIDHIGDLSDIEVSGILAWWMGLGKTLGCEELIMRQIISENPRNILILMPNAIREQVMKEVGERITKAQFATLLSSAFHAAEFSKEEVDERLIAIFDFIQRAKSPSEIREALILNAALPHEYAMNLSVDFNAVLTDHTNYLLKRKFALRKRLFNAMKMHVAFAESDSFEQMVEKLRASASPKVHAELQKFLRVREPQTFNQLIGKLLVEQQVPTKALYEGLRPYFNVHEQDSFEQLLFKLQIAMKQSTPAMRLKLLAAFLMVDPQYPYLKTKEANFPGKTLNEFRRIISFNCSENMSSYSFKNIPENQKGTHIYFGAYHEIGSANEDTLKTFAARNNIGFVFADEAHTLCGNEKRAMSKKNAKIKDLFNELRSAQSGCRIIPCSGTFMRGDLSEFLNLLDLFNPAMLSKEDQAELLKWYNRGKTALKTLLEEGLEGNTNKIKTIARSYARLIHLVQVYQGIAARATPKDKKVTDDWAGRMPTKETVKRKYTLEGLGIAQEVRMRALDLDSRFQNGGDMTEIQAELNNLLVYPNLTKENVREIVARIENASDDPIKMAQELSKSYRASSLVYTPSFIEAMRSKKRVIVFCNHENTLDVMAAYIKSQFKNESPLVHVHNGKTTKKGRSSIISTFQEDCDQPQVLLLSLNTGAVGLNFPEVDEIYLLEALWDPAQRKQAKCRNVRGDTTGHKIVTALDELEETFAIERNRQHILKMKKTLSKFFSKTYTSHTEHSQLYVQALLYAVLNIHYKNERNLNSLNFDVIQSLTRELQAYVATESFQKMYNEVKPLPKTPVISTVAQPILQPNPSQQASTSIPYRTVNLELDEALAIPIPNATYESATGAADMILNNLHYSGIVKDLHAIHEATLYNGELKNSIRQGDIQVLQGPMQKLYNYLARVTKPSERDVHIYTFHEEEHRYVARIPDTFSQATPICLRQTALGYDVLIPKSLLPQT